MVHEINYLTDVQFVNFILKERFHWIVILYFKLLTKFEFKTKVSSVELKTKIKNF
jgi:hypothetical protein